MHRFGERNEKGLLSVTGRGGARRRRDAESGVSAIEFVILTPFLFFLIFATVQFAIYFFARHVAIAAAQEGDRVARAEAATSPNWKADATDKAKGWVGQLGPSLLVLDPKDGGAVAGQVVNGNDWSVSVTVSGSVPSLMFWAHLTVSETSTGPVERFIPDN